MWGDLEKDKLNNSKNNIIRINDHFLMMLTLAPAGIKK